MLLLMEFLPLKFSTAHAVGCWETPEEMGEVFRLDAKAEGDRVAVGRWLSKDGGAMGSPRVRRPPDAAERPLGFSREAELSEPSACCWA